MGVKYAVSHLPYQQNKNGGLNFILILIYQGQRRSKHGTNVAFDTLSFEKSYILVLNYLISALAGISRLYPFDFKHRSDSHQDKIYFKTLKFERLLDATRLFQLENL